MNFTAEIKRDILAQQLNTKEQKRSLVSALMRTCGALSYTRQGLGFVLVTENESVGELCMALLEELYCVSCVTNAEEDKLSGRDKLTIAFNGDNALDILIDLGIFDREGEEKNFELSSGISKRVTSSDEARMSYIKGAFLGGGSCTLPGGENTTGYHLEFVFAREEAASDFVDILLCFDVLAKVVKRKESFVVYLTALSAIADFLSLIGAKSALNKLEKKASDREESNNSNRVNNCFVNNMDRTATASAKQCLAIEFLRTRGVLKNLDEELQKTAYARIASPEASLQEIADGEKISKSCLNHRLRRLMELYEKEKGEKI